MKNIEKPGLMLASAQGSLRTEQLPLTSTLLTLMN